MYQYVWFNKKNYKENNEKIKYNDINLIKPSDIEYVRLSYWSEHCLECAPPQCYNNCTNWVERFDKRCQKFFYGIYDNKNFNKYPYHAELKFRKWGKLETHIFPGTVSIDKSIKLDRINKHLSNFILGISKVLKPIIPNARLSNALEYRKSKFLRKYNKENNLKTNTFLFQAYSYDKNPYAMCLDIFSEKGVFYREKLIINPGLNQIILDLTNKIDLTTFDGLARLYPENDYEANIVILFSDFVKLKNNSKKINKSPANKVKCVVWDLDNTIWDNILIESNPNELKLRNKILDTIINLDNKGIIQTIVSKNTEKDALPVLKRLGISDYFVYKMINWNSKSSNIEKLSELLNINIDTFAFIDDSIYERNEVLSKFPCIRVYDENIIDKLLGLDEFDVPITEESKNRREMYLTEAKRKNIKMNYNGNNIDFLRECDIKIKISNPDNEKSIIRSYELVQRTNQLNLSGKKYSKEEFIEKINREKDNSYVIYCEDKFGVYGQVGYFVIELKNNNVYITEFAMSCRVAGKYVESAIINWLQNKFSHSNFDSIIFKGINNKKNKLLIDTLVSIGMNNESANNNELILKINMFDKTTYFDIVNINK